MSVEDPQSYAPLLGSHARSPSAARLASTKPNTSDVTGTDDRIQSIPTEGTKDSRSNAILLAQGHRAAMRRSFSPFAALGLGFSMYHQLLGRLPELL